MVVATTNHVLAPLSGPHPPHEVCESSRPLPLVASGQLPRAGHADFRVRTEVGEEVRVGVGVGVRVGPMIF